MGIYTYCLKFFFLPWVEILVVNLLMIAVQLVCPQNHEDNYIASRSVLPQTLWDLSGCLWLAVAVLRQIGGVGDALMAAAQSLPASPLQCAKVFSLFLKQIARFSIISAAVSGIPPVGIG